ncbi:MAG: hypothetical protein ACRD96_11465, partial [Bryobacteraceae bacterium]
RYTGLDPRASYKVRVAYTGEAASGGAPIRLRLVASGDREIHPYLAKPVPFRPLDFDIPADLTAGGELRLKWNQAPGMGSAGRGLQISEVWLMKR